MRAQYARVRTVTAATMLTLIAAFVSPSVAFADSSDTVTLSEVATALRAIDNDSDTLVATAAPSTMDADSAAVVQQDGSTTDIPKNPEDGVGIKSKDGTSITIDLPQAEAANDAQRLSNGTVVYPASDGSANAVIPTSDGIQFLTSIYNSDAPTRYNYDVSVPEGGKVEVVGGAARVVDADGGDILYVGLPWAKDANGIAVPTHFEVEGNSLIQVVEHNGAAFTYPVVADPRFYYSWGIYTVKFNSTETGYISRAGGAAVGAYLGGPAAAFFTAIGGDWLADYAAARRLCLTYRLVPYAIHLSGLWVDRC